MQEDHASGFENRAGLSRRDFVKRVSLVAAGGGLAAAGLKLLTPTQRAEAAEAVVDQVGKLPKIQLGTRMGKMEISRIVISSDWNRELYGPALALGANFVHKAGYWRSMPADFKNVPRESYYTDITVDSTPDNPDDEDRAYNQVTQSLASNGLGYYDIFRAHFGWHTVDAFKNQTGTYKAFQRLKKEGKVKYFGVSQHTGGGYPRYPDIIQAEIDSGLIDSMQVWLSAATRPDELEIFAQAHKAGIGITAMKVVAQGGGRMNDPARQKEYNSEGKLGQACTRYSLSVASPVIDNKPIAHCCVLAIRSLEHFEENMGAVGAKVAQRDGFILNV